MIGKARCVVKTIGSTGMMPPGAAMLATLTDKRAKHMEDLHTAKEGQTELELKH